MDLSCFSKKAILDIQSQSLDSIFFGDDFAFQYAQVQAFADKNELEFLTPFHIYAYLNHLAQVRAIYPLVSHNIFEYLLYASHASAHFTKQDGSFEPDILEKIRALKGKHESLYTNRYLLLKMYQSSFGFFDFAQTQLLPSNDVLDFSWDSQDQFQKKAMLALSEQFTFTLSMLGDKHNGVQINSFNDNFLRYLKLSLENYPDLLHNEIFLKRVYQVLECNRDLKNQEEEYPHLTLSSSFFSHNDKLLSRVRKVAELESLNLE